MGFNLGFVGQIMEFDIDVEVDVRMRVGFEDVKWELWFKMSDKIFVIVMEDVNEGQILFFYIFVIDCFICFVFDI